MVLLVDRRHVKIVGDRMTHVIRLVVSLGHHDRLMEHVIVRNLLQQVMNAVESRSLLVDSIGQLLGLSRLR